MSEQDLFNFIWQIADLLRGPYRPPQYERVMLPMVVLRRFDCVLKATKSKVVAEYEKRKGGKLPDDALDALLNQKAGPKSRFHNRYPQTLEELKGDSDNVHLHLVSYINGFSANVRKIFEYFDFAAEIARMHESNILFMVVQKFCEVDLEKLTGREMGKLFEHLIRKFNEQANETAGDHFTPREVVHLMVDLLFIEDDEILAQPGTVRTLLDPACGTAGMLSEALNYVEAHGYGAELHVFGQDYNKRSYAVAAADLLMKDQPNSEIAFGDSLTDDKFDLNHAPTKGIFNYHLANPPFGVDWKRQKREIETEHRRLGFAGRFGAGLPRINDGALLFLQHMIHKFEPNDPKSGKTGARLAIVFNGSPLFTGGAGSGESDIRKWIIENDWLEAIVALPEQMFFNTGIGTYIWVVTNRKSSERKGKIQLVDARDFYVPMRKSLGNKRRKIGEGSDQGEPNQIAEIVKSYGASKEVEAAFVNDARGNPKAWVALIGGTRKPKPASDETLEVRTISKVFDNEDFGHRRCTVERPLRLCYQMTTERKSRFLDALPQLLDAVQAIDKAIGREPNDDWNEIQKLIEPVLEKIKVKWKKAEWKLFRDVFCETSADAQPVIVESRKLKRDSAGPLYGWYPHSDGKTEVKYEADTALRDAENIPLKEDEAEYFTREVLPFVPDAWIDADKTKIGYEINFNRHFYIYKPPRPLSMIDAELKEADDEKHRVLIAHFPTDTTLSSRLVDSGFEWIGLIPSHWRMERLGTHIVEIMQGWSPQCDNYPANDDEWGVLKVGAVNGWSFDAKEQKRLPDDLVPLVEYEVMPGDILMSRANTTELVGRIVIVEEVRPKLIFCDKHYRIRLNRERLDPKYLFYFLRSPAGHVEFELAASGASNSMQNISQETVRNVWLPVPPIEEQLHIAERISIQLRKIDQLQQATERSLALSRERRSALIAAAVTGQISMEAVQ